MAWDVSLCVEKRSSWIPMANVSPRGSLCDISVCCDHFFLLHSFIKINVHCRVMTGEKRVSCSNWFQSPISLLPQLPRTITWPLPSTVASSFLLFHSLNLSRSLIRPFHSLRKGSAPNDGVNTWLALPPFYCFVIVLVSCFSVD